MFYLGHTFQAKKSASLPVKTKSEKPVRKSKVPSVDIANAISHKANKGPNMSRKISGTKLYPFPSFDKCDSLLFFPSTFASCMNTADWIGLGKLLKQRTDKSCGFFMCGKEMDLDTYLYVFGITNDMHPDCMAAVHQTKVVGNQIIAMIYYKYSENTVLRKAVEETISDPTLLDICPTPRSNTPLVLDAFLAPKSEEEKASLTALVNSTEEIKVFGKGLLTLTFDDATHKITRFDSSCEYTSFSASV